MKTKLSDLFDQMDEEKGNKLDEKIQVEIDKETEEIIEGLYKLEDLEIILPHSLKTTKLDKNLQKKYSAKTIEKFSLALTDEIIENTLSKSFGIFLNYLIYNSEDKNHTIHTNHLATKINEIGIGNTKNITIHGDVGNRVGEACKSGKIEIFGNAGTYLGDSMYGGKIIVHNNSESTTGFNLINGSIIIKGDCGDHVGYQMNKGLIKVYKNLGKFAGEKMKGGTLMAYGDTGIRLGENMYGGIINVHGNIKSLGLRTYDGYIYHKGKQILRQGRRVELNIS